MEWVFGNVWIRARVFLEPMVSMDPPRRLDVQGSYRRLSTLGARGLKYLCRAKIDETMIKFTGPTTATLKRGPLVLIKLSPQRQELSHTS
jgi:hypothetical protein